MSTAYNVILSDGNRSILIPPLQVSENLVSIPLVGQDLSGYGNAIATAQLRMLENFSSTTPPTLPLVGQLWYDRGQSLLRVYSSAGDWEPVGEPAPESLNDLSDVTITNPQEGDYLQHRAGGWVNAPLELRFTDLTDTPSTLQARRYLRVNNDGTRIIFQEGIPAIDITGIFELNQLPLQAICQWLQNNCDL